jgi:hypothetical protein
LKVLVRRRVRRLEMITEAMVGLAIMEPPLQFEMRLRGFLDGQDAEPRPADEMPPGGEPQMAAAR